GSACPWLKGMLAASGVFFALLLGLSWLQLALAQTPATENLSSSSAIHAPASGNALLLEIRGPIGPATTEYLRRGLQQAREQQAAVVILRIDTPGGLVTSLRDINRDILPSPIPIIAYVAPGGAQAASAGTYMVYASHVAAMAPGTNLGAATPVAMGGAPGPSPQPPQGKEKGPDQDPDQTPAQGAPSDAGSQKA